MISFFVEVFGPDCHCSQFDTHFHFSLKLTWKCSIRFCVSFSVSFDGVLLFNLLLLSYLEGRLLSAHFGKRFL